MNKGDDFTDIDFTKQYRKGDIIFLARCINNVGIQEVLKLTLRTIDTDYMVGCVDKSISILIEKDLINNIFNNHKDASTYLKKISKKAYKESEDIPSQLLDEYKEEEEEETDDINAYIDSDEEDEEDE